MAPAGKLVAAGLIALYLVAGCTADSTGKMDVQAFANEQTAKIANVQAVSPAAVSSMLDQIGLSINSIAGAWWEIEWASQQSQWDTLVMLANTAVQQILQILPEMPTTGGLTWGSKAPHDDMVDIANAICQEVSSLKSYAEEQYNVLLTITSLSACSQVPGAGPTAAPAPTASRRLLMA